MLKNPIHILVLGQSNVASHGEPPGECSFGRVFHAGRFLPLRDPVLGGTGEGGSVWTRFAVKLQDAELVDDLIISLRAVGGTAMQDWSTSGKCFSALRADLPEMQTCPVAPTHVVFHQGERDNFLETAEADYVAQFDPLYDLVRQAFPQISWIFCQATYRMGVISHTIRQAQARIIAKYPDIHAGPDTDAWGDEFRIDGTHFNQKGLDAFAESLLRSFVTL